MIAYISSRSYGKETLLRLLFEKKKHWGNTFGRVIQVISWYLPLKYQKLHMFDITKNSLLGVLQYRMDFPYELFRPLPLSTEVLFFCLNVGRMLFSWCQMIVFNWTATNILFRTVYLLTKKLNSICKNS